MSHGGGHSMEPEGVGYGPSGGSSSGKGSGKGSGSKSSSSSSGGSKGSKSSMKRGSGSADHESAAMSHGGGSNDRDVITSELNAHSGSRSPSNSHSHSASHSHSSHSHSSELTSDEVPKGCVWDKSGCINGLCDEQAMEDRCNRLNHDKDQCEGELGQLNRCEWYHGVNYSANKHKAVLTEEEVELE